MSPIQTVTDLFNGQIINFFLKAPKIDRLGIKRIYNTIEVMGYIKGCLLYRRSA